MSRFMQYINEGRTKIITKDSAIYYIRKKCFKNFKMLTLSPNKIFRGVSSFDDDYGMINTNKGSPRKSANTFNYMTLLMDNLPSWNGYPLRSQSVICSNEKNTANSYGNSYTIIPFDNSKVGICPYEDVWLSFKFLDDLGYTYTVDDFNDHLMYLFEYYKINVDDSKYESLKNGLIELKKLFDKNKLNELDPSFYELFEDKDIIDNFNKYFGPSYNGFSKGIENVDKLRSFNEIWIQGECILINNDSKEPVQNIYDDIWDSL